MSGSWGAGIALQFKESLARELQSLRCCLQSQAGGAAGAHVRVRDRDALTNPRYIINFPTKRHWRGKSRIEDIEVGLDALVAEIRTRGIRSIALPPLGSGLGGLSWGVVRARIEASLGSLPDVDILVFEPTHAVEEQPATRHGKPPEMTARKSHSRRPDGPVPRGVDGPFSLAS